MAAPAALCPDKRGNRRCICHGTFLSMKHGSGWIRPIEEIDHPSAQWNQGDVYLSEKDICPGVQLEAGDSVVFYLYVDAKGLGAENCSQVWTPQAQAMRQVKQIAFVPAMPAPSVAVDLSKFFDSDDDDDSEAEEVAVTQQKTKISLADILNQQPLVPAELPSVGSALHVEGTCKRCSFFPKGTCQNGSDCEFCHFEHEKRPKRHKRKSKTALVAKEPANFDALFSTPIKDPMKCEISDFLKNARSALFQARESGNSTPTTVSDGVGESMSDFSSQCGSPEPIEREAKLSYVAFSAPPGLAPPPPSFPPPPQPISVA